MNSTAGDDGSPGKQLSPGPKARVCYICGRQYGTASYEIHLKQCKELWIAREAQKDPKERKKLPEDPFANGGGGYSTPSKSQSAPTLGSSQNGEGLEGCGEMSLEEMNRIAGAAFNTEALDTCKWCSRSFLPEKLLIHNKSCTQDNPARKASDSVRKGQAPVQLSQEFTPGAVTKRPQSQARFKRPSSTNNVEAVDVVLFPGADDAEGGVGSMKISGGIADSPGGGEETNLRVSNGNLVGHLGGSSGRGLRKAAAPKPSDSTASSSANVFGMPQDLNNKEEVFNFLNAKMKNLEATAETIMSELAEIKAIMTKFQASV